MEHYMHTHTSSENRSCQCAGRGCQDCGMLSPEQLTSSFIPSTPDPFEQYCSGIRDPVRRTQPNRNRPPYMAPPVHISLVEATMPSGMILGPKRVSLVDALDFETPAHHTTIRVLPFPTSDSANKDWASLGSNVWSSPDPRTVEKAGANWDRMNGLAHHRLV